MSAAVRETRYRSAVYGDLAYDLEKEVRERELRHAGEERREQARPVPRVRSVSAVQVRARQRVPVLAVLGFVAVVALAAVLLMSYVQLTELSASVVDLQGELKALQTQNVTLTAQYQQMYDLSAVKEAAEEAGMTKPGSGQIYYIDLSDGDSAVVYQSGEPGVLSRILTSLNHGFYTLVEYFD